MGKILIVLSAADHWMRADGTLAPAGFWAEELINMHRVLVAAGQEVDVATPGGMTPVPDPDSLNQEFVGPDAARFKAYLEALAPCLRSTLRLSDVSAATYGAVVIPGGHGPLEDLYKDPDMGRLLEEADRGE
ncbi:hypothetical protein DLJ53_18205 [Acuticoccus sediminis]|uniref:DJ-1/PfpI family protein n=1 Tax=Acuticoccus sediminis TaxID=2184697 RepID=A0A8B2NM46_9HYPH|nr:type 1 glutamine amidotransferase domain-containing protein [Acuticoccus sediminis]RAH99700.1 hypothetical protein DLJ53_18205 [Acuticoccus sediminis]